ncbi:MAG: hypothetical protein JW726_07525 [Anaerolineales bacterium]|nr:hypothetical protein [Anaerolineales bacterium]
MESIASAGIQAINSLGKGDDFLISDVEGDGPTYSALAYNDDLDEYLVVYKDERYTDMLDGIFGQFVSGDGVLTGGCFAIYSDATDILISPTVAYDTVNARYLVTWTNYSKNDIEGVLLGSDGHSLGPAFDIADGTPSGQYENSSLAFHSQLGDYLVVYQRYSGGHYDVFGKRVSAMGIVGGTEYPFSTAVQDQFLPRVSANPADGGDFLVVWEDSRAGIHRIYGCLMDNSWTMGSEFIVVAHPTESRTYPSVAFNPQAGTAGEWLVAYQRSEDGDYQIGARRVSLAGAAEGLPIQVSVSDVYEVVPEVTYSPDSQEWVVIWEDDLSGIDNDDLRGRVVAADGSLPADAYMIYEGQNYWSGQQLACGASDSGCLVVLISDVPAAANEIIGQRVETDGSLIGHAFTISLPRQQQRQPAMAYNSVEAEFLVVWQDQRGGNWNIWGQRVRLDGVAVGETFPIVVNVDSQLAPDVAYNLDTNQYLVVWEDQGINAGIYAQRVNADGTLDGGDFAVATSGDALRSSPRVVFNPISGAYFVVYETDEENGNIQGRRVPAGDVPGTAEIDIATGEAVQRSPDVACRTLEPGGGSCLVVWREAVGEQDDIRGQRVGQAGTLQGEVVEFCSETHDQFAPGVAYSPESDRYLVAWPDDRDEETQGRDIYGRQMDGEGVLDDELAISTAAEDQLHLTLAYHAPRSSFVALWDDSREVATGADLYGQCISAMGRVPNGRAATNALVFSGAAGEEFPALAWDETLPVGLAAWQDDRSGDDHIYGILLNPCEVIADRIVIYVPLILVTR